MKLDPCDDLEEKVRFLSSADAHAAAQVEAIETHMSWVFLARDRAYKLKKPVRYPFLDFSQREGRRLDCEAEVRLNRRLAGDIYIGVAPLVRTKNGALAIGGAGVAVDWLVVMKRLPRDRMLDQLLTRGELGESHITKLALKLSDFYRHAERPAIDPSAYSARLTSEQATNRDILTRRDFAVDHGRVPALLANMDSALAAGGSLLEARAASGELVDGHGDLRPEHVCYVDGLAIFDCLEFSDELRLVDPVDEIAFLSMECEMLGGAWVRAALTRAFFEAYGAPFHAALFELHTARRAILRARLALAHLLDAKPREPAKWEPMASRYLAIAETSLERLKVGAT